MTLERRPGGNADDVRRDLGAAMASAARREGVSTRHDVRPLAFEQAAIASSASRSTFPEAFSSVSFINAQADGTAAGGPRAHGEGARRWTLLSRQSLAQDASRAGPPVPRRLYDPEVDGAGQHVRTDNDFNPAAATRGGPTRAGVAAALGYGPASVDLSVGTGTQSLARPSSALRQPPEGTSISLTDKDVEVFTGVLVVRKAAAWGA